jgi:hypothetical protein
MNVTRHYQLVFGVVGVVHRPCEMHPDSHAERQLEFHPADVLAFSERPVLGRYL